MMSFCVRVKEAAIILGFYIHFPFVFVCVLVAHLCLTLCNPTVCRPWDSSVHEIFQARILQWVAIPFSRGSFQPRDRTRVICIVCGFFTIWAIREAPFPIYLPWIALFLRPAYVHLCHLCLCTNAKCEHRCCTGHSPFLGCSFLQASDQIWTHLPDVQCSHANISML